MALAMLLTATSYVGGYFLLSDPYYLPDYRIYQSEWQHDIYEPATRIEGWLNRREIGVGWSDGPRVP
jgi:hypothetical protein